MAVIVRSVIAATLVALFAAPGAAQDDTTPARVSWLPPEPVQGSLVRLVIQLADGHVTGDSAPSVTGHLAGQPLHFEPDLLGGFQALGPIPMHSQGSIPLTLTIRYADGDSTHQFVRIPVTAGEYPVERLRVARQFVEQPDSALAARIAEERDRAREVSRRTHRTPRVWRGQFTRPTPGRITSEYGRRREFNGQLQSRHWGVDLDGELGTPVVAANRGVVALVGDFYYSGRVIYLDHGHGLVTAYLHLSEIGVAAGDTVSRGQIIGAIGASGRVTGPHLHWTAKYGNVTVNPMSLLELDLSTFGAPKP